MEDMCHPYRMQEDMDPTEWKQKAKGREQLDMKKKMTKTRMGCN